MLCYPFPRLRAIDTRISLHRPFVVCHVDEGRFLECSAQFVYWPSSERVI